MNKKVIILNHNGGRLANQLWLFISIYAYCLEKGYKLENLTFWEYSSFYNFKCSNFFINIVFFKSYSFLCKILPRKPTYTFRKLYSYFVKLIEKFYHSNIIYAFDSEHDDRLIYLPPSDSRSKPDLLDDKNKVYTIGWLFRNPFGIKKYHKEIVEYFRPKAKIINKVKNSVLPLREKFKNLVGIHIRQGDFKLVEKLYFNQREIKNIIDSYILNYQIDKKNTCFVICSDDLVNEEIFKDYNIYLNHGNPVEDLITLASTGIIIGPDSTFGAFAAYYGNIPFVVYQRNGVDWEYYKNKSEYFENKYCTTVHY